jgi:catechol 2,3-dioxygenase-like lactoylglutathione lyase family enzyme
VGRDFPELRRRRAGGAVPECPIIDTLFDFQCPRARFGRLPHRNEALASQNTAEEATYLAQRRSPQATVRLRHRHQQRRFRIVLDHVSLGVSEIDRSRRFYDTALGPLGLVRIVDFGNGRGSDYGAAPGSLGVEFTITLEREVRGPTPGGQVCFRAPTRAAVGDFHAAALLAGGRDDGAPGLRPKYHADYYAAFALDPDGHRIEAVCHAPPVPHVLKDG